jgi:hypothetical protein
MFPRTLKPIIVVLLAAVAAPAIQAGTVTVSGTLDSDTTWTAQDTVLVTGIVAVSAGAELTIEAGTVVLFNTPYSLQVYGRMRANGSADERIVFSSSQDYPGGSPTPGSWAAIYYQGGSSGSMEHCDVRYAQYAVRIAADSVELNHCVLENFSSRGVYIVGSSGAPPVNVVINNSVIRQTLPAVVGIGTALVAFRGCNLSMRDCDVSHCSDGIDLYSYNADIPTFELVNCTIHSHTGRGIYAHSSG